MIQLLRVDHRLLHGQVVFSWCGQLNPNCILIANDAAATDDVRKAGQAQQCQTRHQDGG